MYVYTHETIIIIKTPNMLSPVMFLMSFCNPSFYALLSISLHFVEFYKNGSMYSFFSGLACFIPHTNFEIYSCYYMPKVFSMYFFVFLFISCCIVFHCKSLSVTCWWAIPVYYLYSCYECFLYICMWTLHFYFLWNVLGMEFLGHNIRSFDGCRRTTQEIGAYIDIIFEEGELGHLLISPNWLSSSTLPHMAGFSLSSWSSFYFF